MIEAITSVWTDVMEWITTSLGSVQDVFYTPGASGGAGSLTFLGTLFNARWFCSTFLWCFGF